MPFTHIYDMSGVSVKYPDVEETIARETEDDENPGGLWASHRAAKKAVKAGTLTREEALAIKQRFVKAFQHLVNEGKIQAQPVPGIKELFEADKAAGVEIAIFTTDEPMLTVSLEQAKLAAPDIIYDGKIFGQKYYSESHEKVLRDIFKRGNTPHRYIEDAWEKVEPHVEAVANLLPEFPQLKEHLPICLEPATEKTGLQQYTKGSMTVTYALVQNLLQVKEVEAAFRNS